MRRVSRAPRRCIRRQRTAGFPVVQLLIDRGANVNLPGRSGITPLSAAAYMGSVPIVELFIAKGVDPKTADGTGKSAIIYAAGRGFPAVVRLLLDHGVDVNARYGNDLTVLMWAAGYSDEAGVQDDDRGHQIAARSRRAYRRCRTIAAVPR